MRDQHWIKMAPHQLPHTLASEQFKYEHPVYSTDGISVKGTAAEILLPDGQKKFGERVDGQGYSGSFIRRLFRRNSRAPRTTELHCINTESENTDEPLDNNTTDETNNADNDFSDFDKLKKVRRALMKQRIIKYMEALKAQANEGKMQTLVDEILNSSTESNLNKS